MNNGLTGGVRSIFAAALSNSRQVKCIKQNIGKERHLIITHIGGDWGINNARIVITEADAIRHIKNKIHSYFVQDAKGDKAFVEVIEHKQSGKEFLKTIPDYTKADNLLLLPQCV